MDSLSVARSIIKKLPHDIHLHINEYLGGVYSNDGRWIYKIDKNDPRYLIFDKVIASMERNDIMCKYYVSDRRDLITDDYDSDIPIPKELFWFDSRDDLCKEYFYFGRVTYHPPSELLQKLYDEFESESFYIDYCEGYRSIGRMYIIDEMRTYFKRIVHLGVDSPVPIHDTIYEDYIIRLMEYE